MSVNKLLFHTLLMFVLACQGYGQVINPAMNDPDRFAWDLFFAINRDAPGHPGQVIWETWIEQNKVFENPCAPPVWPDSPPGAKTFHKSLLLAMVSRNTMSPDVFPTNLGNFQEVRYNKVMYDYIVANQLWYQEGIVATAATKTIDFHPSSIVIKAEWAPIKEEEKSRYYWTVHTPRADGSGTRPQPILLGLVGLHIVSKAIPIWFWSTWEHVDNAGRCDYIGCKDSYGSIPAYIEPHTANGRQYPPGELNPEVLARIEADGLDPVWRYYRLKGTQNDFTDTKGNPTLLAHSIMEARFEYTSSCTTCHAMATLGQPGILTGDMGQSLSFIRSLVPFETYIGVPDPAWYSRKAAGLPLEEIPIIYQTDFLWSLPFLSRPRTDCDTRAEID